MRSLVTYACAALAVLGLSTPGYGQRAASATPTSLSKCDWQPIGQLHNVVPRALAVTRDGAVLLAGDDLSVPAHSTLVTLRWDGPGASWQVVDRYLPETSTASGARALALDGAGNVYVLAWEMSANGTDLLLRRSFAGGDSESWESGETRWPDAQGGALATAPDGRVYVAHGFAGPDGIGWRVESAPRGEGDFQLEDELQLSGIYAAIPEDMARATDGSLYVVGQLHGASDEWLVRGAATGAGRGKAAWKTLDRYAVMPGATHAAARAAVPLADGRLFVAGLATRASGNDYQWVERWQSGRGRWQMRRYQLQSGMTSMAQDAAATPSGVAVLGIGTTSNGMSLVLREGTANNQPSRVVLQLPGVNDLWAARLAVGSSLAAVATSFEDGVAVIGCALR